MIANKKHQERKFAMDERINFIGKDEKGIDCRGLSVEALERFNNNLLLVLANYCPNFFAKKNDLYITIDHIPKIDLKGN